MTGHAGHERVVPFRGDYYRLRPEARRLVRALIYPVNDPRFPFLGIHVTRRMDGDVWAGPNAALAFAREGYRRTDIAPRELAETLADRGFLRLAFRFWRAGAAEMLRDVWKPAFAAQVRRYLPELRDEDLESGPSGVRAQSVRLNGELVDDFSIGGTGRVLHVETRPRRRRRPLWRSGRSSRNWRIAGSTWAEPRCGRARAPAPAAVGSAPTRPRRTLRCPA